VNRLGPAESRAGSSRWIRSVKRRELVLHGLRNLLKGTDFRQFRRFVLKFVLHSPISFYRCHISDWEQRAYSPNVIPREYFAAVRFSEAFGG
jgi:hypothetical protein